jgi:hypothetical protein
VGHHHVAELAGEADQLLRGALVPTMPAPVERAARATLTMVRAMVAAPAAASWTLCDISEVLQRVSMSFWVS